MISGLSRGALLPFLPFSLSFTETTRSEALDRLRNRAEKWSSAIKAYREGGGGSERVASLL